MSHQPLPSPELPAVFHGMVTPFQGDGRRLGYPTANLDAETSLPDGIYFGFASLAGYRNRPCLIFIGVPLVAGRRRRRVEAHVLGIPDRDYYGRPLTLDVRHFHRPNQKFASASALTTAMRADEAAARQWFADAGLRQSPASGDT